MIDKKNAEHVAKLARLKLTDQESEEYSGQMAKVLAHFDKISQVATAGVEPLVTPTEIESFWREDVPAIEVSAEDMLGNAPDRVGNLFKVPPVV